MSSPNPSTRPPAPVYRMEANGVANIITAIDSAIRAGRPIDTAFVRLQARLFDSYVAKLEEGRDLAWHEHLKEAANKPTPLRVKSTEEA